MKFRPACQETHPNFPTNPFGSKETEGDHSSAAAPEMISVSSVVIFA